MLCKVVLTFEFVDEVLKRDLLNESFTEQYFNSCGVVYYAVYKVVLAYEYVDDILKLA